MLSTAIVIATTLVCLSLILNLWRLFMGPGRPDRILALDTMYINSIALIILFGIYARTTLYFEAALLIAT